MKVVHSNIKRGVIKLKIENLDDLWYISHIVDKSDLVTSKTTRKIKLSKEDERRSRTAIKHATVKLQVEKIEFHKYSNILRISGIIIEAPEDISKGSHHTFNIEEETILTINKEKWLKYQLEKIQEASEMALPKILICVHDREEAFFALLKRQGYQTLSHMRGTVQKKQDETKVKSNFYFQIIAQMKDYVKRYDIQQIILASPAFWTEELMKNLTDNSLKEKINQATCSTVSEIAINEILKRSEIKEVLKKDRITKEMNLVEDLLTEISKNNLAAYSLKETGQAVMAGAVKDLLITDKLIMKMRQQDKYEKLDSLMTNTEKMKGTIHIINSDHDGGKKLDGLGGIGAILRYKIS